MCVILVNQIVRYLKTKRHVWFVEFSNRQIKVENFWLTKFINEQEGMIQDRSWTKPNESLALGSRFF